MSSNVLIIIIGAGLATYFTRFPLMILSGKKGIPLWLERYMSYIAPAVLTSLIVPAIFIKQGKPDFSLTNEYILAAAITSAIAYVTKNMLFTVIMGVCIVGILMYIV